ncbi:thiamine pyrophosphate-dependent enzyme [Actinomadura sp. B10D3]|uniref:thiamine pyrophosphate-dependent enzyme n=1 Tax=Actinomadura sp. B10D3 TaxID=3153557 RepID=UPI00325C6120
MRDDLVEAYRLMTLMRRFDEKATSLQRQGRLGTLSIAHGQEAAIAGAVLELDPGRDWVVPQYRELTALTRHGFPLANVFCHYLGNPAGDAIPEGVRMLPVQISLAAQLPHAVGLAWGERLNGTDGVVLAFFGEGSSSEGDFHEACNLAGVVKAPVVFLLQNNGWAISTPRSRQTAAETFASRAPGYGIHGDLVDGNDLVAVRQTVGDAVRRARAGEGATLIEAVTYRLGPHSTADDPTRYVPEDELARARANDPVDRLRQDLYERGWLDVQIDDAIDSKVRAEIAAALAEAERVPRPALADLMAHVYANPPARLAAQIAAERRRTDA